MIGEIKKIDSIKRMAVFQDFRWKSSVRDKGKNIAEFQNINVLYGRNYSGKTTLSRIFRSMEIGSVSKKYDNCEFQLTLADGREVTQNTLANHGVVIRVFNEDFVKENLSFIFDEEQTINSFAILGEDNTRLKEEIGKQQNELGSEEGKFGLIGKMYKTEETYEGAENEHNIKSSSLEDKLREKANNRSTGIKHNKEFGNATYNIKSIRQDIASVSADSYNPVSSEQLDRNRNLLKEEPKSEIPKIASFDLRYKILALEAKQLIEKKIRASEPIQELMNDAILETWVRSGREIHNKRMQCAFCGSNIPIGLWDKLDKHFNKESEELRISIDSLIQSIDAEKNRIPNLFKIKNLEFYSQFKSDLVKLGEQFSTHSTAYCHALEFVREQLEKRKSNIFTSHRFVESASLELDLVAIYDSFETLRSESNQFTAALSAQQSDARTALRLHEVFRFIKDIKYSDECESINNLKLSMENAKAAMTDAQLKVSKMQSQISDLKAQLKDESKGAERVNYYLNNFFGHQSLSLKAIKNSADGTQAGYRFDVIRNNKKAFHLSEGECSLIAFCYFMAKLKDVETEGSQPIIWIDDPVSSLDANHIFFVYSLINAEIVTPKSYVENGQTFTRDQFKQLFISTHNLDFLKYLKRLPGASDKNKSQYFIVNRVDQISDVAIMPRYLKDYITEFNYLFNQIYKCASIEMVDDQNYTTFYNFGNNTRKFFEIYLYYRFPDQGMNDEKLRRFFGEENVPAILTDRINNEYSHLAGTFERGSTPIEAPEMKTTANYILQTIKERDPEQYSSLLKSIGVE